jgi:hypothetical protein
MFLHNKRLQYTVRVAQPNPGLANLSVRITPSRPYNSRGCETLSCDPFLFYNVFPPTKRLALSGI